MNGPAGIRDRVLSGLGSPRQQLTIFIELFALSGLLIAQPAFDFLGKNARELTVFRLTLLDTLAFVVLVLVVPPALLLLAEAIVAVAAPRARRQIHVVTTCVLLGVIAGNYVKVSTHLGVVPRLGADVIVTALVVFALRKTEAIRQWLRYLAIAPLVFALLFVTASPASILLFQDAHAATVPIAHPARVVMIVFDEFPEESLLDGNGHIDAGLYPNFAKLAADSTWYRNDTTVAEFTARAVPAILTGKYPQLNPTLPLSSKYPQSLFTLLGKTYKMHAHEVYEQLCPVSLCDEPTFENPVDNLMGASTKVIRNLMDLDRKSWDTNKGFRFGVDNDPGFESALDTGESFVDSLAPSAQPTLDYLHILVPHQPWRYLAGGTVHGDNPPLAYFAADEDPAKVPLAREMHLLNVQATDWYLGRVLDKLRAIGVYDNSLIVVTADHGVSFPFVRSASPKNYDHILWTPLLIKAPHQSGARVDDLPTESVDVLPTIASELGVKIPWKIDGVSALGERRVPGPVTVVRNDSASTGVKATFDGIVGFDKVLRAQAAPAGGDESLRLYRIGTYGDLVGKAAAPFARASTLRLSGLLKTPGDWNDVDPASDSAPWTTALGAIPGVDTGTVAIAVNGRVSGLGVVIKGSYFALLAPEFFHKGQNDVRSYLVLGTRASPRLAEIAQPTPGGGDQSP